MKTEDVLGIIVKAKPPPAGPAIIPAPRNSSGNALFLGCGDLSDLSDLRGAGVCAEGKGNAGDGGKGSDIANYKTVKIGSQTWMAENLDYNVEGSNCDAKHLKAASGLDSYGFAALPGGHGVSAYFGGVVNSGYWWSSSEDTAREMSYSNEHARWDYDSKAYLRSVRCLHD